MRFRLWPLVSLIFAMLLVLVIVFAWSVARKSRQIDARAARAHTQYQRADDAITNIRADVYRSALLFHEAAGPRPRPDVQQEIARVRSSADKDLVLLYKLLGPSQTASLDALRRELQRYWQSATPADDGERRQAVLTLAERIDAINEASIHEQENEIRDDRAALRRFALWAAMLLVVFSVAIGLLSIVYLARLEQRSELEKKRAED